MKTDASSGVHKIGKSHHSPVPNVKSKSLAAKNRGYSRHSNKSALSSSNLSSPVEECLDEDSEDTGPSGGTSGSDVSDEEEDKIDLQNENPTYDKRAVTRAKNTVSAHTKKRTYTKRVVSMPRNDSVPSMSRHARKGKKIPFSVRKPTNDIVVIHKWPIDGASETVFFDYPKYVGKSKEYLGDVKEYSQDEVKKSKLILKIAESTHIYNSIVNSWKNAGFFLTDKGRDWNLLWTGATKLDILKYMNEFQKVNHFPGSYQLGRKDLMWKCVQKQKRIFGDDYNIAPKTYIFPNDYTRFVSDAMAKELNKNFYIMKPVSSSCGNGIKVINASVGMPKNIKNYLVSKYLSKPHLIKGFKYDMRIYILVTSYDPLVVYMFKDGLVRFSTEKYSLKTKNLKKRYIHLTNYSVNKKAENYVKNKNTDSSKVDPCNDDKVLSKWSYQQLQQKIKELGHDWDNVELQIKDVIIKTLISAEAYIVHQTNIYTNRNNSCFEIYGFDILLDHKLKPWLLEVNTSPSFSSSSPFDKNIKTRVIWDALTLIGVKPYDKVKYKQDQEKISAIRRVKGFTYTSKSAYDNIYENKMSSKFSVSDSCSEVVTEFVEQEYRMGGYERIFPLESNVEYYSQFFERERTNNELLKRYLIG